MLNFILLFIHFIYFLSYTPGVYICPGVVNDPNKKKTSRCIRIMHRLFGMCNIPNIIDR